MTNHKLCDHVAMNEHLVASGVLDFHPFSLVLAWTVTTALHVIFLLWTLLSSVLAFECPRYFLAITST